MPRLLVALFALGCTAPLVAGEPADPLAGLRPRVKVEGGPSVEPPPDGKARTSLFGLVGEGHKFVYVFDRSGSMGGAGRKALAAVKAELRTSLENLDTVHQFQIIFYNERPIIFNPSGEKGKLAFATARTKERALRFIDSIVADGGTEHEDALRLAIRLRPDVIFFLTDGDEPRLSRRQLDGLREAAAGTTLNVIEFGTGPRPAAGSFLETLADENAGKYVYVDLAKR